MGRSRWPLGAVFDLSGPVSGTTNNLTGNYVGSGAGFIELNSNTLTVGATLAGSPVSTSFDFTGGGFLWNGGTIDTHTAGTTLTNQGLFTVAAGVSVTLADPLINSGTLTIDAGSTLTVGGTYTQTSSGTLAVPLGGTAPDSPANSFPAVQLNSAARFRRIWSTATVPPLATPSPSRTMSAKPEPSAISTWATGRVSVSPGCPADQRSAERRAKYVGLAALSIDSILPASGFAGQNETIQYTVINNGGTTPVSSWVDSVFLSATESWTRPQCCLAG